MERVVAVEELEVARLERRDAHAAPLAVEHRAHRLGPLVARRAQPGHVLEEAARRGGAEHQRARDVVFVKVPRKAAPASITLTGAHAIGSAER